MCLSKNNNVAIEHMSSIVCIYIYLAMVQVCAHKLNRIFAVPRGHTVPSACKASQDRKVCRLRFGRVRHAHRWQQQKHRIFAPNFFQMELSSFFSQH